MHQDLNKNQEFRIKDQYEAALLFGYSMNLERTEKINGIVFFIFENKNHECERIIKNFYQNRLNLDPKIYVDSLITIKHLIFNSD